MPVLHYSESAAELPLDSFVDCYWSIYVDPAGVGVPIHWVLPDSCLSFAIRFDSGRMRVSVRPPAAFPLQAPCGSGERLVGVRFRPGAHRAVDVDLAARSLDGRRSPESYGEAHLPGSRGARYPYSGRR